MGEFVGLICDGNRRDELAMLAAAGDRKSKDLLSREELIGCYTRGAERVKEIIECARDSAVDILAVWGLSDKNVDQRSRTDRDALATVFETFLRDVEEQWMDKPENAHVRMVHMGNREGLKRFAPGIIRHLDAVTSHTRERTGMVVALCLDYGGIAEQDKAQMLWAESGHKGYVWDYLDLPKQGVPFREVDLLIRTGEEGRVVHDNAFLHPYMGDGTYKIFRPEFLPQFTSKLFLQDLEDYRKSPKRRGK